MPKDYTLRLLRSYTYARSIFSKQVDPLEQMVNLFIQNIEAHKDLNAFVRVYKDDALAQAKAVSPSLAQGGGATLSGMVVGLKDVICYKDHGLEAGSKILEGFVSQITATCVERLLAQGAIIIGHQNCDEFGMGSATVTGLRGRVKNFLNPALVAGGSSGGSAVAVQGGMCHVSLGTDTGGSVRQPAAFCGIIGLKPTYGRISRYGMVAYASSFDTIGILANTVADCAKVLEAMAGHDPKDNTASRQPVRAYVKLDLERKPRIAYLRETIEHPALQPEIKIQTEKVFAGLRAKGFEVAGIDFPLLSYALPTYYILTTAEASANLARYDGVRYGFRAQDTRTLREMYTKTRTLGFGTEVKRRILLGTFVLSASYHDAYYTRAQKVRKMLQEAVYSILQQYDYILLPTTPTTAFAAEGCTKDPVASYLADLYTVPASVVGLPALSIPNGRDNTGLPIGLQIIGKAFDEGGLLGLADYLLEEGVCQ